MTFIKYDDKKYKINRKKCNNMKNNIKFIHCSDIHLGANPFEIDERFEDMGKAFMQVCDFALAENVDFVLIAGDFFHNKTLNPKTLEQAINALDKLKSDNIPVFLTEGNHDMETYSNVYSWLQFLSSREYIYLLRPNKNRNESLLKFWDGKSGCIFERKDSYIMGLGYPGSTASKYIENVRCELEELKNTGEIGEKPIICMLHTGIDKFVTEGMGGLREQEVSLLLDNVDYLALGHIHTRYENPEKKYYNPGAIECVRITDNPFNKGFYYVNIDENNKKVQTEFKVVETRNSVILEINIDGLNSDEECEAAILNSIQKEYEEKCIHNSKIMLQIKITGTARQGTRNIDITALKGKIADKIPVLHQEIINLIRYVNEDDIVVTNDIARDEIDKMVIKNKIKKSGVEEHEVDSVFNIIEKLKEYGVSEQLDINSTYGEEIEKMLINLAEGGILNEDKES